MEDLDRTLEELTRKIDPQLRELLQQAAQAATDRGWHLYLVGGAVRDLLLATATTDNLSIQDIDLVVDSCQEAVTVGAGVAVAQAVQKFHPGCRLHIYGSFQTAALIWEQDPIFNDLGVDFATARTEVYPYPAANPIVTASTIDRDLYRRDFTINAIALRLTPDILPPLLDLYGGLADLQGKQLRVLHGDSFIDDPTRIYRGARLANRLGFELEAQTVKYFQAAVNSGIYQQTAQANPKTPALQSRLKTELKYLLEVPYWRSTIELLANLGALQCIHSTLRLDRELLWQLRLVERCWHRFDRPQSIEYWQLRLEIIIAHLAPADRESVAINLQLSQDSIARLAKLSSVESQLKSSIVKCDRVSQVVGVLGKFDLSILLLIAVRCRGTGEIALRRQIWKYLTVWRNLKPILNGDDLRRLGYQPGQQYREILAKLLDSVLDGDVTTRLSAEEFLKTLK